VTVGPVAWYKTGTEDTPMSHPEADEVDILFALVRRRYGDRLGDTELADVRRAVQAIVEGARALRAVRLSQPAEPAQPFLPCRGEP
jgi:hypothetical protein